MRPRKQEFGGILMENGAFYMNSVGNILRDRNRLSGQIAVYEMPDYSGAELDSEDDWIVAEALMRKHILSGGVPTTHGRPNRSPDHVSLKHT
jgi:N-acylneuraminate cytidylyltransferase